MRYNYRTSDTCSTEINFEINDGVVSNISFIGGCNGNLKAVSVLVDGMKADEAADKLKGITCGRRLTSCADQFAAALIAAMEDAEVTV